MGGDHKCPVCQATFTRPQHVARHMRSHTGDRPYKCIHCGDQFARSDLLSRHINKCHASESAPNTTGNTRRKGSASATRATTSKQACDQCVQSSLPCDGCNPCSKCVQRKCRCTFVKFHRQTAPSGPGHNNPRPASVPGSLSDPRFSAHLDDLLLVPPPVSVPSMSASSTSIFSNATASPYSFSNFYPDPHQPLSLAGGLSADPAELAKYRSELLRRSLLAQQQTTAPGPSMSGLYVDHHQQTQPAGANWLVGGWNQDPALDASGLASNRYMPIDQQYSDDGHSFPAHPQEHGYSASSSDLYASDSGTGNLIGSAYRPRRGSIEFSDSSSVHSVPSSAASSSVHLPLVGGDGDFHHLEQHQHHQQHPHQQQHHLSQHPHHGQQQHAGEGGFSSAFGHMSIDDANLLAAGGGGRLAYEDESQPFFASGDASGEMGLGMDMSMGLGLRPPPSPNATPMPMPMQSKHPASTLPAGHGRDRGMSLSALPVSPSGSRDKEHEREGERERDLETRELKEFWKQYMRTPLSSSGAGVGVGGSEMTPGGGMFGMLSSSVNGINGNGNGNGGRRARVSSLPSSKTPTDEYGSGDEASIAAHASLHVNGRSHPPVYSHAPVPTDAPSATSSMRTTLHAGTTAATEDLRSYEAAVNARNNALKLNLVPRRKAGSVSTTGVRPSASPNLASAGIASLAANAASATGQAASLARPSSVSGSVMTASRPSSSSSSSSLAHAFGEPGLGAGVSRSNFSGSFKPLSNTCSNNATTTQAALLQAHHVRDMPPPSMAPGSRESSVSISEDGGSDGDGFRPSFKRLPSQTLGPATTKRALLSRPMDVDGPISNNEMNMGTAENMRGGVVGVRNAEAVGQEQGATTGGGGGINGNLGMRPIAALPERHRRASEAQMMGAGQ